MKSYIDVLVIGSPRFCAWFKLSCCDPNAKIKKRRLYEIALVKFYTFPKLSRLRMYKYIFIEGRLAEAKMLDDLHECYEKALLTIVGRLDPETKKILRKNLTRVLLK